MVAEERVFCKGKLTKKEKKGRGDLQVKILRPAFPTMRIGDSLNIELQLIHAHFHIKATILSLTRPAGDRRGLALFPQEAQFQKDTEGPCSHYRYVLVSSNGHTEVADIY